MAEEKKKFDKIAYNNAFNAEKYDRVNLTVPKGNREKYREHANKHNYKSLNDFAIKAMENQMAKDNEEDTK